MSVNYGLRCRSNIGCNIRYYASMYWYECGMRSSITITRHGCMNAGCVVALLLLDMDE